jgi:hypothetical protein
MLHGLINTFLWWLDCFMFGQLVARIPEREERLWAWRALCGMALALACTEALTWR